MTLTRLRRRARGVDVVVAHGSRTLPASLLALAGSGIPFVYKNIGDTAYWSASASQRWRVGAALRRSSNVVALTPQAREALMSHHSLPSEQVVVIPSWRSGSRFRPGTVGERAAARERFGIPLDATVCVILGALAVEKRVDLAIQAVARGSTAHLLVVGDGPERGALEELGARMLPGRVHFAGSVDDPEHVLVAGDVLLLSSVSEGVPGVIIEAGLCQLPAVAFEVGGVRSVVEDGVTGRVVPFADVDAMAGALDEVLAEAETMGARAREHFLAFHDTEQVVDLWVATLEEVAAKRDRMQAGTARS
jgi:glycosyltransferase involved in cell wall biosynthesis